MKRREEKDLIALAIFIAAIVFGFLVVFGVLT